jgi:hypothetical protein
MLENAAKGGGCESVNVNFSREADDRDKNGGRCASSPSLYESSRR